MRIMHLIHIKYAETHLVCIKNAVMCVIFVTHSLRTLKERETGKHTTKEESNMYGYLY